MSSVDILDRLPDAPILERGNDSLMYIGQTTRGRQIWLDREDLTRHLFVSGSTGSGKTELLLGMCANSMAAGDGLLFVDGKGDISTFAKIFALASKFGRGDDVLLLNFSQGVPVGRKAERFLSNTANPLLDMSADAIVQMLVGLMEEAGGDNAMWKGRAIAMLTGVIGAATWMRDNGMVDLTVGELRKSCQLGRIVEMSDPALYPDMPQAIRDALRCYLGSLPGYQAGKGAKQSQTTLDQHGYLEMQTTRMFSSLADVYGHIFSSTSSHIDMRDVVLNRRILVVLLPVLEKSRDEVANLGRIVVGLVKNMMSHAMAAPVEGDWVTVVEKRPTNAAYPFLTIMDEASHYLTDGMALMAGQARSLGFAMVFAVQDIAAMEEVSRRETKAILANTNTKIFMNMQTPGDHTYQQMLPSNERYNSPRAYKEDEIKTRLSAVIDRLRWLESDVNKGGGEALRREMAECHEALVRLMEEDPYWSLVPALKRLAMGEFIVVRNGKFLRGRSLYVSPTLGRPDIALNHFVAWAPDADAVRARYERGERRAAFLAALSAADPSERRAAFAPSPLSFRAAYGDRPWKGAKSSIRRAFAAVGGYTRMSSVAAGPAAKPLVVLGE
jgi:hypothetical protein